MGLREKSNLGKALFFVMKYNYLLLAAAAGFLASCSDEKLDELTNNGNDEKLSAVCLSGENGNESGLRAWTQFGATSPWSGSQRDLNYRFVGDGYGLSSYDTHMRKVFKLQTYIWMDYADVNFVDVTGTNTPCQFSVYIGVDTNVPGTSVVKTETGVANQVKEQQLIASGKTIGEGSVNIYNLPNYCYDLNGQYIGQHHPMLHAVGHVLGLQHETENPNSGTSNVSNSSYMATPYDNSSVMASDRGYWVLGDYINGTPSYVPKPMPSAKDKELVNFLYGMGDKCRLWNFYNYTTKDNSFENNLSAQNALVNENNLIGPLGKLLKTTTNAKARLMCSYYDPSTQTTFLSLKLTDKNIQRYGYQDEKALGYAFSLSYAREPGTVHLYKYVNVKNNKKFIYSLISQRSIVFNGETFNIAGPIAYVYPD